MTTASDLITAAFREGNFIPVGTTPTVAEQTEALALLNRFMLSQPGKAFGEKLTDWLAPHVQRTSGVKANYPQLPEIFAFDFEASNVIPYPPKNSRVVWGGTEYTIYLPENPDDGSRFAITQGSGAGDGGQVGATLTLNGNGYLIDGNPTATFTNPLATTEWTYRADLATWKKLLPLQLTDEPAYSPDVDDYWIIWLALRLAPRYDKTLSQATVEQFKAMQTYVKTRYQQTQDTTYNSDNFPNASQSYRRGTGWY